MSKTKILQYLTEQSEPLLVFWRTSTGTRILPVQIQTIKTMSPQKSDGGLNKRLPVCWCGHHFSKPDEKFHEDEINSYVWHTSFKIQCFEQDSYCSVPKFHPPTAKRVFKPGFLSNQIFVSLFAVMSLTNYHCSKLHNTFYLIIKCIHKQNLIAHTFPLVHWKICREFHHSIQKWSTHLPY